MATPFCASSFNPFSHEKRSWTWRRLTSFNPYPTEHQQPQIFAVSIRLLPRALLLGRHISIHLQPITGCRVDMFKSTHPLSELLGSSVSIRVRSE
jgi:hypothetical protein